MSLQTATVPPLPDLACVGMVKEVGEAYLSERGVYHVIPVQVQGKWGGRDATFYFIFEPLWFSKGFDPNDLLKRDNTIKAEGGKSGLYSSYRRNIAADNKVAALQAFAGEEFPNIQGQFDNADGQVDESTVEEILREALTGRDVGYVLRQREDRDEDGKRVLTEQYNIGSFFDANEAGLKAQQEKAENPKRRKPLVITWDEDAPF